MLIAINLKIKKILIKINLRYRKGRKGLVNEIGLARGQSKSRRWVWGD